MERKIYQIGDGRLWDTEAAAFIETAPEGIELVELVSADGPADEACLARALNFYGYPLGELADSIPEALLAQLAELDAEWLSPRTLGALATGDAAALARWQEHEALAAPIRAKLAVLRKSADN